MLRPTSIRRHRRVNSSMTTRNFSLRPSLVSSNTKSYVHTWFGYSARLSEHAFSLAPVRSRSCFTRTTFNPPRFQSRCTRLTFTRTPFPRSSAQMKRYPYAGFSAASSRICSSNAWSRSALRLAQRCVDLACPNALHARRSEIPNAC